MVHRESNDSNLTKVIRDYLKMGVFAYLKIAKFMVDDYVDKYGRKIAQPMLLIRGVKIRSHRLSDWNTYRGKSKTLRQLKL